VKRVGSPEDGATQERRVNRCRLDPVEVSSWRLFKLVRAIMTSDDRTGRFPERDIKGWVEKAVGAVRLDLEQLPKSFQNKMGR
jgi:hypothetical protein